MIPAVFVGVLVAAHPMIASHLSCPSSRDIESQLSVLMPDTAQPGSVVVSGTPDGLLVDLRPENLTFAATRTLTVGGDCEERARAAAVVISTWWPVGGQVSRPSEAQPTAADKTRGADPRTAKFRIGAGAFASLISDSTAFGGRLEACWVPPHSRAFGLRASTGFTGAQTTQMGQGQAHWSRATAEMGPTYSIGYVRLDVGAVASASWMRGSGFDENQTSRGTSVGMTVGGRTEWLLGRVVPWIEARGFVWPQSQTIYALDTSTGIKTSHALPHAELQLGGGIALSF